ncbi:cache domain-containing protein [Inmirania thermothiophila]|uniref:histidine kinase n=1 Tax=Inmirania thermothiophila TaxID=1750597 RepID=A0A3N1Y0F3_9GAMM|nr:cache domain-containing protein [Inmirania thermothiophila]ROR32325.1 two-component system NtrC family sensor kinase [Inmirania thermothiophila]
MLRRALVSVTSSLRRKLLVLVLLPVAVMPLLLGLAVYWGQRFSYDQLFMRVRTDLAVADAVFRRLQADYLRELAALAASYGFLSAFRGGDVTAVRAHLAEVRMRAGFAFLHLTDPLGRWLLEEDEAGIGRSRPSPLLAAARAGRPGVGIEVFDAADLARERPALAERVRLPLVPTPQAAPTERTVEDRGLVVRVVQPLRDAEGRVVALLDGGVLLNGNFAFVDAIRDLVYGPGSLPEGSLGTVTVFLDDVRISTNVPLRPGQRALGTRVSQAVRDRVLGLGATWIDRAFVVNDWYISGYEPLFDVYGNRVGMLYAGFLEAPYRAAGRQAVAWLALAVLGMLLLAVTVAVVGARSIFRPIEVMADVVRAHARGEDRRIGPVRARDEIGELARRLDRLLDQLESRNRQISHAAEHLEREVARRTRELEAKNASLERTVALLAETRRQLVVAEKLAALGELTAGIAHEINNPVAVILGNLEVALAELGEASAPVRTELDLIGEQARRIQGIVGNLLRYARPSGVVGEPETLDLNEVVRETLPLVRHAGPRAGIEMRQRLAAARPVACNRQELQQVLVNLLVNALRSMPGGGVLEVATEDWARPGEGAGAVVHVRDSGEGIAPEHLGRIFDPFFTTRRDGTGLGLSISYGIVRHYGGRITVASAPGQGSTFSVWLPAADGAGRVPRAQAGA